MESFRDLNFVKDSSEDEIISKLVLTLKKKPAIEKVSCEEIDRISLNKNENAVVAFIVPTVFMHPMAGFIGIAVHEMTSFPEDVRARYVYNDEPECPKYLGMTYITERIRVFLPGNQHEDISLNVDKLSNIPMLTSQVNQLIVNSQNKKDLRSTQLLRNDKIFTIMLLYDKSRNDIDEIKRLRKIVREASNLVKSDITNPAAQDSIQNKLIFIINNNAEEQPNGGVDEPTFILTFKSDKKPAVLPFKDFNSELKYLYDGFSLIE